MIQLALSLLSISILTVSTHAQEIPDGLHRFDPERMQTIQIDDADIRKQLNGAATRNTESAEDRIKSYRNESGLVLRGVGTLLQEVDIARAIEGDEEQLQPIWSYLRGHSQGLEHAQFDTPCISGNSGESLTLDLRQIVGDHSIPIGRIVVWATEGTYKRIRLDVSILDPNAPELNDKNWIRESIGVNLAANEMLPFHIDNPGLSFHHRRTAGTLERYIRIRVVRGPDNKVTVEPILHVRGDLADGFVNMYTGEVTAGKERHDSGKLIDVSHGQFLHPGDGQVPGRDEQLRGRPPHATI